MYVHIGGEYQIPAKSIVAILNLEQAGTFDSDSPNCKLLKRAEETETVEVIDWEIPRSFIVTLDRLYLSPIAAATLRKRIFESRDILYSETGAVNE